MNALANVPPGFRFHPTDEELVDYYLRKKVGSRRVDPEVIREVDLYKIEPWDLQERCRIENMEEQSEWYFFSHKDKKYPTGSRTNRATAAGFWKATGRDKPIYGGGGGGQLVGMRKTLVFYRGRAPNGHKSDWIMHEYRLQTCENTPPQEEGWVVCRVFKKRVAAMARVGELDSPYWYEDHGGGGGATFTPEFDSPRTANIGSFQPDLAFSHLAHYFPGRHSGDRAGGSAGFIYLPQLESPKLPNDVDHDGSGVQFPEAAATGWRALDMFVASQLSSHLDHPSMMMEKEEEANATSGFDFRVSADDENKLHEVAEYVSTSITSCSQSADQLWK